MNLNQRLQSLEAKLRVSYITLKLKDGTECRVPGEELWATAFETQRVWSELLRSLPADQHVRGVVPPEVIQAVPLLQTILNTVSDDAEGYAVNLIQNLCSGPHRGDAPVAGGLASSGA